MAPRPFWTGYLKLSLVTCPVGMTPAVSQRDKVRFHTLNRKTGDRVETRYLDAGTGKPVNPDGQVKGYARGESDYVMLEDEEVESIALESTRTIDIDCFIPADSLPWIWYDRPHFLTPDGAVAEEAFAVIRDAMAASGTLGISRLVLYRRERPVMLESREAGIVLWTLRYGDEVREPAPYFENVAKQKVDTKLRTLAEKLVEDRTAAWSPKMVGDPVQARLLDMIHAKEKGRRPPKPRKVREKTASNVVDIMDALQRSLAEGKRGAKGR